MVKTRFPRPKGLRGRFAPHESDSWTDQSIVKLHQRAAHVVERVALPRNLRSTGAEGETSLLIEDQGADGPGQGVAVTGHQAHRPLGGGIECEGDLVCAHTSQAGRHGLEQSDTEVFRMRWQNEKMSRR